MVDPRDRLDGGRTRPSAVDASLDRTHRLEEENRALRAEIVAIKAAGGRPGPRPIAYWVGLSVLALAAVSMVVTVALVLRQPAVVIGPPPQPPAPSQPPPPPLASVVPVTKATSDKPSCAPPYYYDERNNRVFKKECL